MWFSCDDHAKAIVLFVIHNISFHIVCDDDYYKNVIKELDYVPCLL